VMVVWSIYGRLQRQLMSVRVSVSVIIEGTQLKIGLTGIALDFGQRSCIDSIDEKTNNLRNKRLLKGNTQKIKTK